MPCCLFYCHLTFQRDPKPFKRAAPIPPQNHSTGLSAPFQFNSGPNSSPQRALQSSGFLVYWRVNTNVTQVTAVICRYITTEFHYAKRDSRFLAWFVIRRRGLFTSKEKIPWPIQTNIIYTCEKDFCVKALIFPEKIPPLRHKGVSDYILCIARL